MGNDKPACHIGTSGWSYNHWKGPFYPSNIKSEDMLSYYCQQLKSVEINSSFYRLPSIEALTHWYDNTPEDFLFSVKASRYITHMKKLNEPEKSLPTLFERISVLGKKLGPVLFQLPPHWHCNHERLAYFLGHLSAEFRYAFEFRDQSWLNEACYELLSHYKAALCIYEYDGFVSPRKVTTDFVYIRLHGPDGPYQGSYDMPTLAGWADDVCSWRTQGRNIYCYFDNDESGYAARNAVALEQMLHKG